MNSHRPTPDSTVHRSDGTKLPKLHSIEVKVAYIEFALKKSKQVRSNS